MSYITCIEEKNDEISLHFSDAAYINGFFWVSALEWNGYYRVNIDAGSAELLGTFENIDLMENKLFSRSLAFEKYVFFIPWFSNYLVKLNIENLGMTYYKLPSFIIKEIAKFREAVIYEKKIYMFPHIGDNICIFDIEAERFLCDDGWAKEYYKFETSNVKDRFVQGCRIKEQMYLASFSGSFIMRYNLNNYQYKMIFLPEDEKRIVDITVFNKDSLIILTWRGNVWSYNVQNGCKKIIYQYDGGVEYPYRHVLLQQDYILLIPALEERIIFVDKEGKKLLLYPNEWGTKHINVGINSVFNRYYKLGNVIILYPCLGNMMIKIDVDKKTLIGVKMDGGNNNSLYSFINLIDTKKDKNSIYRDESIVKGIQIWNGVRES